MTTLPRLQRDPFYLSLPEDQRAEYEAAYRKTLVGQSDALAEAAAPLGAEITRLALGLQARLAKLRDIFLRTTQ